MKKSKRLAGGGGFGPPQRDSESRVLPLDHPPFNTVDSSQRSVVSKNLTVQ